MLLSQLLSNSISQIEMEGEEVDFNEYGIRCFLCQQLYTDIDELQQHLQEHSIESTENTTPTYYNCDVCGRSLRSEEELNKHMARFHATHLIKKDIESGNRFKCDKCNDIYISFNYLEKHIQSAHNARDERTKSPLRKDHKLVTRIIPAKQKYAPRSPFFNPYV